MRLLLPLFLAALAIPAAAAEDAKFVDGREARRLTRPGPSGVLEASTAGGDAPGVTLLHTEAFASSGLSAGRFEDGAWTIAEGTLGKANLEVGSAWGYATANAVAGTDGFRAGGSVGGTLTAAGVTGTTRPVGFGREDDLIKGALESYSYARLGADGYAAGLVHIGREGAGVGAQVGAFVGASTQVAGLAELDIGGVSFRLHGGASAGYGLGGEATAFFTIDWAQWKLRVGGKALAGFGPAAGTSVDVEIRLDKLMRRLGVHDALSAGVTRTAAAIRLFARKVAGGLGLLGGPPAASDGASPSRTASTRASSAETTATTPREAAGAAPAGVAR